MSSAIRLSTAAQDAAARARISAADNAGVSYTSLRCFSTAYVGESATDRQSAADEIAQDASRIVLRCNHSTHSPKSAET